MYLQVNTLYFLDVLSILRSASVPDLRFVLDFSICSYSTDFIYVNRSMSQFIVLCELLFRINLRVFK